MSENAVDIYVIYSKFTPPFASGDLFPNSAVAYSMESNQSTSGGTIFTNSDLLYAYSKNVTRNGKPTAALNKLRGYNNTQAIKAYNQVSHSGYFVWPVLFIDLLVG